jgi:hypothetical protein
LEFLAAELDAEEELAEIPRPIMFVLQAIPDSTKIHRTWMTGGEIAEVLERKRYREKSTLNDRSSPQKTPVARF